MTDDQIWVGPDLPLVTANLVPPPMSFVLPGADGQPLISISLTDGSIEYGPNYETDAAAHVFWAAMQAMFGSPEAVFGHGLAARVDAELAEARETNRQLNHRAQQAESKLAVFERAVREWRFGAATGTYVPLRSLGAIAKAVGREIPERWELHYQRVEQAEAALAAVRTVHRVSTMHDAVPGRAPYCENCRFTWPCPTIRASEGALSPFAAGGTIPSAEPSDDLIPAVLSGCQQTVAVPELTHQDALELLSEVGQQAYQAEDRLAFIAEMCDAADRDGIPVTTERVRSWLAYTGCGGAIVLLPDDVQEQLKAGIDQDAPETEQQLHARRACPGWEYATTEGPRKQWDDADRPPSDDNADPDPTWERNVDAGRDGWDRFDYTEESYWRRRITRADPPAPPH